MNNSVLIGIDGNEANVVDRVGSNMYAYGILQGLWSLKKSTHFVVYLKELPVADMPAERPGWEYRVLQPKKAWTQWRLPLDLYVHKPSPQVFFSPGHYGPRKAPMPTVVSIMDLAYLKHPSLFLKHTRGVSQLTAWTDYSVRQSEAVIAISQQTKKDVMANYAIDEKQIVVAYPGIDTSLFAPAKKSDIDRVRATYGLKENYILYVGTLQPRKNLSRLLKAFEGLHKRFEDYQLVLSGQKGWLYDDFVAKLQASKVRDRVRLTGYVAREDLPALYSGAACSCLVGLYEGFGMPPAEALACGTIPVVSNNSSLPEVVGEAGILVDPYSSAGIRHGISAALSLSPEMKEKRWHLGMKHLKQFDWQLSAEKIYNRLYDIAISRQNG